MDVNAILQVRTSDKGTGRSEKIEIVSTTSAYRRITQEEIEQMMRDAEEFAEENR